MLDKNSYILTNQDLSGKEDYPCQVRNNCFIISLAYLKFAPTGLNGIKLLQSLSLI
jgi:hypothetical protein